jgi:hypothetical protein
MSQLSRRVRSGNWGGGEYFILESIRKLYVSAISSVLPFTQFNKGRIFALLFFAVTSLTMIGCNGSGGDDRSVRPRSLRDVPAERLAFRFEPDIAEVPPELNDTVPENLATVAADFETRRTEDALLRTVVSPDGQRVLALYGTGATEGSRFRMDLYASDGRFLRNIFPAELNGVIPDAVAWSPDGGQVAFIGLRDAAAARATPTPVESPSPIDPALPQPSATIAPLIPPVQTFTTGQIYICDLDGFNLRPLTTRDGLIYFHLAWSPDSTALVALACRDAEWDARLAESLPPGGRPRIISLNGNERLLDDRLTDVLPVWSPDGSKVATAFGTDVAIYDAANEPPTAARLSVEAPLLEASARYDAASAANTNAANNSRANASGARTANNPNVNSSNNSSTASVPTNSTPLSFNPIVRLEWVRPDIIIAQTGFVRVYGTDIIARFMRWHIVHLSPQSALLSHNPSFDRLSSYRITLACERLRAPL